MINIPFSGSKRFSYKQVKELIKDKKYKKVYEPFGGSGILSVNLFNEGLVEEAIINDYDRFFDKYEDYLDLKDKVVEEGFRRGLVKRRNPYLPDNEKEIIRSIISEYVPREYWRYFFLGNNFTFSTLTAEDINRRDIRAFTCFGNDLTTIKQRKYIEILKQITIENLDYKEFLNKFDFDQDCLLIVDPPYHQTYQRQYEDDFCKQDTIELINYLNTLDCDYIFFNRDYDLLCKMFGQENVMRTGLKRGGYHLSKIEYVVYSDTSNEVSFFMPKK